MSNLNLLGSEEWAIVATIDPATYAVSPATQASDVVDMSKYHQLLCIIQMGILGAGGVVAAALQSSTASAGSYSAITGKAITSFDDSPADSNNNYQAVINLRSEELTEGHRYVKLLTTPTAASTPYSAVILGKAKSLPSSDSDLASVLEIVA